MGHEARPNQVGARRSRVGELDIATAIAQPPLGTHAHVNHKIIRRHNSMHVATSFTTPNAYQPTAGQASDFRKVKMLSRQNQKPHGNFEASSRERLSSSRSPGQSRGTISDFIFFEKKRPSSWIIVRMHVGRMFVVNPKVGWWVVVCTVRWPATQGRGIGQSPNAMSPRAMHPRAMHF